MKNKIKTIFFNTQMKCKKGLEKSWCKKRKGDSKFIAAALLMLFAIVLGAIFYKTLSAQLTTLFTEIGKKITELIGLFTG